VLASFVLTTEQLWSGADGYGTRKNKRFYLLQCIIANIKDNLDNFGELRLVVKLLFLFFLFFWHNVE
jgi:hypothetical protein